MHTSVLTSPEPFEQKHRAEDVENHLYVTKAVWATQVANKDFFLPKFSHHIQQLSPLENFKMGPVLMGS